ncbi:MAG: AMP-binding protein [Candidatus Omnitrophica bacterium]|nr:AMP-binding protein [Candidatus Omnitrophota bacterium]
MKKHVNIENVGILDLLYILTKKYNSKPALQIKEGGKLTKVSYDDLRERSVGASTFLIEKQIPKGAHIAILSENRPEWAIAFFGIISAACVTVPIDAKLSLREIFFILNDSKSECIFVSEDFVKTIYEHKNELPFVKHIICFGKTEIPGIFYLNDLKRKDDAQGNRPKDVSSEDSMLIVYTSGTTGVAKGVELSYKNLLFEVMSLYNLIKFTPDDSFVSLLPLNHTLEITGGLIAPLYGGATVTYCDTLKPANIISLMNEVKATGMICVPLILKMFYGGIIKEAEKQAAAKRRAFYVLFNLSHLMLKLNIRIGRIIFKKIYKKFGKNFKCFVSGGAPLDVTLEKNFNALGFTILQGYGLTETAPVVSVNTFEKRRYGSVGRPLSGVSVKILKASESVLDGEIVVRGPNVMKGYYNGLQKTEEVLRGGWFYTGDIGYIDEDGFLFISGRIKNLIVLGGGKKIFPEEVEQVMSESPYIKEVCVLGRQAKGGIRAGSEEVYAVIVPNTDKFSEEEKKDKEKIKNKISSELNKLSENLAEYKRISDFSLYFDELPKTSTRKIKRKDVLNLIEKLEKENILERKGRFLENIEFKDDDLSRSLRSLIANETGAAIDKINQNAYLYEDLGIDSLQKVELLCVIEKELGVHIPENMAYEIRTFADLAKFAAEYREGRKDIEFDVASEVSGIEAKTRKFYIYRLFAAFFMKVFFRFYFKLKVSGRENLPQTGSFIIAANHSSHLDFPLIYGLFSFARIKKVVAPAASDYFYSNKLRKIFTDRFINSFSFERFGNFMHGLKVCKYLLKQENCLVIFPEGTRVIGSEIGEFKPGVGMLASELSVPIVPLYVEGADKALPKGKKFIRPAKINIKIGKPFVCGQGQEKNYLLYKKVCDTARQEITALKNS